VLVIAGDPWIQAQVLAAVADEADFVAAGIADPASAAGPGQPDADLAVVDLGEDAHPANERPELFDHLEVPVLALVPDAAAGREALAAGARAVLARDVEGEALVAAMRAVVHGLAVVDPSMAAPAALPAVRAGEALDALIEELTPREHEVLQLLAEGFPNREIARRLGVSDHTVKFHVHALLGKLGAHTRTEAVSRAARRGMILL
jgi:DNA-binding NarL/FixJ family response regulator